MNKLVTTSRERFWRVEALRRDEWIQAHAARLPRGSRVLDAGAGSGKYRAFFPQCQYETQDFCEYKGDVVVYAAKLDYVCDITAIPVPDGSFDAVLCTEVLEHVVEPVAAVRELGRVLKPGGQLWITTPHGCYVHMEPYIFNTGLTEYWYRHWLPRLGVACDEVAYQGGPGRSATLYVQAFYDQWREAERKCRPFSRLFSLAARMLLKLPIHYVVPWLAVRFDRHLNPWRVNPGLMVAGTRQAATTPQAPSATH